MPLSQFSCQVLRKDKDAEKRKQKEKGKTEKRECVYWIYCSQTANIRKGFEFNLKTEVSGANSNTPCHLIRRLLRIVNET